MSNKYLEALTRIVRHPRHASTGESTLRVEIERAQPLSSEADEPEVIDFSRGGCRLRWTVPLRQHEPIVIKIVDVSSGLSLELPGTIRWSRDEDDGVYAAGCKFDSDVDYEHLGELFLAGFLATEEVGA